MPIFQYFFSVGSVLLFALFVIDANADKTEFPSKSDIDRSIIRISSTRPKPELVLIDTSYMPAVSVAAPPMQIIDATSRASLEPGFVEPVLKPTPVKVKRKRIAQPLGDDKRITFTSLAAPNTP